MRISKTKKLVALVLSVLMAVSMMPFTAFAAEGTKLSECYSNANFIFIDNDTYLDDDVTTDKALVFSAYAQAATTLDLNGHTFTTTASPAVVVSNSDGAIAATIKDSTQTKTTGYTLSSDTVSNMPAGKIESTGNVGVQVTNNTSVTIDGAAIVGTTTGIAPQNNADNCDITIKNGYVTGGSFAIPVNGTNCDITVLGGVVYGEHMGIAFNGNNSGNSLTVSGGNIVGKTDAATAGAGSANTAIYFPGDDTLNISGGSIYGINSPAIVIRSGDVNITGGKITSTGDYQVTVSSASNTVPTAAIVVDTEVDYPGAATMDVDISGGTVTSTDASSAVAVVKDEGDQNVVDVTGGTYTADGVADDSALDDTAYVTDDFGKVFAISDIGTTYPVEYTNSAGKKTWKAWSSTFSGDGTYKLLADVTATARMNNGSLAYNVAVDLNGHNITSTATDYVFISSSSRNGTAAKHRSNSFINTSATPSAITNTTGAEGICIDSNYTDLTIGQNVTLTTKGTSAWIDDHTNDTITINGNVVSTDSYALYVNGTNAGPNTVTVNGSVTGDDAGIYGAGVANYVINGSVTGDTGIYLAQGNLTVNDGATVTATGAAADYNYNGNGMVSTGDAIVIDNKYATAPTATINGGTITSTSGEAVSNHGASEDSDYTGTQRDAITTDVVPSTSTAVFSSDVSDLAEDGYETVYDAFNGGYVVAQDTETEPAYGTAVNCSDAEATITGNATAHTVITLDGATLNFASADPSVGRYYDGYYFTVKFVAPEGTNISQDARYTNGSVDSTTGELKIKNLYNAQDGANYMYSWPYVTPETVQAALEAGVNKEWHYTFDWDGDGIFEQAIDIVIVPTTVKLVKNNEQVYPVVPTDPNNGSAITLEDGVEFNVFIDADAYTGADHVAFTYNHNAAGQTPDVRTDTVDVADATTYTGAGAFNGTKMFDLECAPAQVSEDYTITLYNSYNQVLYTTTYSVAQYCLDTIEYSLTHPEYADAAELCKAVLDYGRAAQLFFNYNTSDIATDSYYNAQVNSLAAADITTAGVNLDGVAVTGVSFDCLSVLNPIIYSTATPSGITVASPVKGNPSAAGVTTGSDANGSYIRVTALESGNINKTLTIATDQGNMQLSSGDICKAIISANADANLVTLARAIYLYGEAANTYFAAH